MAKQIRSVFLEARRGYIPGATGGMNLDPYLKAARLCKELGDEPSVFTMRQIQEMAERGVWFPEALASEWVLAAADDKAPVKTGEALGWYKFQLAVFEARIKLFTVRMALEDTVNPFSPLFRYVIAMKYGHTDIADRFVTDARLELAAHPIARQIFGEEVSRL